MTQKTTAKKASKRKPKASKTAKAVDLAAIRKNITRAVGEGADAMVGKSIEEAKSGHYQALKYLFEISGLYPTGGEADDREEESLSETLLRRLGLPVEDKPAKASQDPEPELASATTAADTIE